MRKLIGVFLIVTGAACTDLQPVEVEAYYDVDSVVTAQYEALKLTTHPIRKRTIVNGKEDTNMFQPSDTSQWMYELNLFRLANINKPELRGAYKVERSEDENEERIVYVPYEPEKRSVRLLEISFENNQLRAIHARIDNANPVFGSERDLNMQFEGDGQDNRLTEYQVKGGQKMILKDTVTLLVNSEILYDAK